MLLGFLEVYEVPGVPVRIEEAAKDRGRTGAEARMAVIAWSRWESKNSQAAKESIVQGLGTGLEPSCGAEQALETMMGSENITGLMSPTSSCREGAWEVMAASIGGW